MQLRIVPQGPAAGTPQAPPNSPASTPPSTPTSGLSPRRSPVAPGRQDALRPRAAAEQGNASGRSDSSSVAGYRAATNDLFTSSSSHSESPPGSPLATEVSSLSSRSPDISEVATNDLFTSSSSRSASPPGSPLATEVSSLSSRSPDISEVATTDLLTSTSGGRSSRASSVDTADLLTSTSGAPSELATSDVLTSTSGSSSRRGVPSNATASGELAPAAGAAGPRKPRKLPPAEAPQPDAELDGVRHKLHRSRLDRIAQPVAKWMTNRSQGFTTMLGGQVREAPAGASGKPPLAKPNDAADVPGRLEEIRERTEGLMRRLEAPATEHAPVARTPKKGWRARIKSAVLGAKPLPDLMARTQGAKPTGDAGALLALYRQSAQALRDEVDHRQVQVDHARTQLTVARARVNHTAFAGRAAALEQVAQCEARLAELERAHQVAVDVFDAADAGERIEGGTATLAKIGYAQRELSRYQAEIAKLLAPGATLPGAGWHEPLQAIALPLARLIDTLDLRQPAAADDGAPAQPEALRNLDRALDPSVAAFAELAQALRDPAGATRAGTAVLKLAEGLLDHSESVYLELSKTVKAETRALRIAASQLERLDTLLSDPDVDDRATLEAARDAAAIVHRNAQDVLGDLRAARTAMKADLRQVREGYHRMALQASKEAVRGAPPAAGDGPDVAVRAAAAATATEVAHVEHGERFETARAERSRVKRERVAAEAARIANAVDRPMGFEAAAGTPGLAALQRALRTAAGGLSPKRSGSDLAASAVLSGLSGALAQVTGGDVDRAARAAHAITHHSLLHWLDAPADEPTTRDVQALHRLLATVPRGMEVLAQLSMEGADVQQRSVVAAQRDNVSTLRVFWLADHTAETLPDSPGVDVPQSRQWLGDAKAHAARKLHTALGTPGAGAATEPSPAQLAAFNGVRNGYVLRGPGTPYAKASAMLDRMMTKWTVAPDRFELPLDENLSSNQIRAAAAAIGRFVQAQPQTARRAEDASLQAFATFAQAHPSMHAGTRLAARHIEELAEAQRRAAPTAAAPAAGARGGATPDVEPVFHEGMTFAEALATAARLANRVHGEPAALREALEDFAPGTGERQENAVKKGLQKVGSAAATALSNIGRSTNPLNPTAMRQLNAMSAGLGMNTRSKISEGEMHAVFGTLHGIADAAGHRGLAILADGLRRIEGNGAVNGTLSREYAAVLQQKIRDAGSQVEVRTDLKLHDYARRIASDLRDLRVPGDGGAQRPALSAEQSADIEATLTSAQRLHDHPELPTVKTLSDMATVFGQFVGADELRDKRKIANGYEFGLGLPLMPWGASGIPFSVSARGSYKKEELLEVGMYINLANITTVKVDGGAAVGFSAAQTAPHAETFNLGLSGAVNGAREWQSIETLSLRLPRQRGTEEKLRAQVPQMMRDLARFAATPAPERELHDPMALLLANHQDLAIAMSDRQGAVTDTGELRLNLLNFGQKANHRTDGTIAGTALGISASLESALEWKKETVGAFVTNDYTSSVKAGINADTLFRMPIRTDDHKDELNRGQLGAPAVGTAVLGGFRNFFQRLDKMQISEATSEGATIDADTDEFSYSPAALLQDLQDNREAWLERGLNVLMKRKPAAVEPHQRETVGRRLAEAELAQFEDAVREMGETNKFTQFNINYSLSDEAKGILGDLRLQEELHRAQGDEQKARVLSDEHIRLLQNPASWEPNKVMARVKAKVPMTLGAELVLKAKSTFQVEGQRVPWQYPA